MTIRDAHSDDMERLLRYLGATDPLELDFGTADRLLDGGVHADDAPRAYSQVARALETLRSMPTEAELANERQAVARIAEVIAAETVRYNGERARARRRVRAVRHRRRVTALALAAAISGVWLIVGLAAANALPKGVQTTASNVLEALGVNVPNPADGRSPDVVVPASVNPPAPAVDSSDAPTVDVEQGGNGNGRGAAVSADAKNKVHGNSDKVPPGLANGTASNAGGNGNGNAVGNSGVHVNSADAGGGTEHGNGKGGG
jgi:hypothetical protein